MKKTVILTLTSLSIMAALCPQEVEARNCIKYPRKCAKDLDRRRRQATQAVIDIATLGHTDRQRDRDRANKAAALAQQQLEHAKAIQERELKQLEMI